MSVDVKSKKLRETLDAGIKHALFSNFSNYSEALLELVDNSVSNRIPGKKLELEIMTSHSQITITDRGGYGMGLKELRGFLEWGRIKKRRPEDIGAYSQGGKAAMGYLGAGMILITSPNGKRIQYRIQDDDLHNYELKGYDVMEIPADFDHGVTQITINNVRAKHLNNDLLNRLLADTYRPLIESGKIVILLNGERIKVLPYPLDKSFNIDKFSVDGINGWVGRLLHQKGGVKGGIRCYTKGRLICDREFFSKFDTTYKQTLGDLFGEVYLDNVPANTNKTNFDRDSIQWQRAKDKIFPFLKPHIDDLLGREIKEPTEEEKERVQRARNIFAEIMKKRKKEFGNFVLGENVGQKQPLMKNEKEERVESVQTGRKNIPRTPPPKDAIGNRKRVREFMNWEIRPIDLTIRSVIEGEGKLLVINNLFPGYIELKGNELYLFETATLQMSLPDEDEKITPKEFLNVFDELFGYVCSNLSSIKKDMNNIKK